MSNIVTHSFPKDTPEYKILDALFKEVWECSTGPSNPIIQIIVSYDVFMVLRKSGGDTHPNVKWWPCTERAGLTRGYHGHMHVRLPNTNLDVVPVMIDNNAVNTEFSLIMRET